MALTSDQRRLAVQALAFLSAAEPDGRRADALTDATGRDAGPLLREALTRERARLVALAEACGADVAAIDQLLGAIA